MTELTAFLSPPIAHRGLHGPGIAENSFEAFEAAAEARYGIELDVQLTSDGRAVVFHDYTLERLTDETGTVSDIALADLKKLPLIGGGRIPSLDEVVQAFSGRAALLVEIKDQSRCLAPTGGALEAAVAEDLRGASGPVAVMSFNPHAVYEMKDRAPDITRGLTTEDFTQADWGGSSPGRRQALSDLTDFEATGARFISHHHEHLSMPVVQKLRQSGVPVFCWTIRSPEAEARARRYADNVTFEGYRPAHTLA